MKEFHYHNAYEIYYLVKGNRNYVIGDEYFSVTKGDIALIKPNVLHKTAGGAYDRMLLYFTEEYLRTYFTPEACDILISCFDAKVISLSINQQIAVSELLVRIDCCDLTDANNTAFILLADVLNILIKSADKIAVADDKITEDGKAITQILHYINTNYAEIENITEIAENFFITKYHLCRIFKGAVNVSVIEYLNRVKIKNTCVLLESTEKSVTEICTDCGFNSSVYFCKLFKRLMNMTPSQYRTRMKPKYETAMKSK